MTTLVIGIDLGGTKIKAVLHDGKKVIKESVIPTEDKKGYKAELSHLVKVVNELKTKDVKAVGLATPGFVHEGVLRNAPNNPSLEGKPLAKDLSKLVKLPVAHENDAKLFALAEAKLGAGKGKKNVLGIIVGTGVGCGIIIDGKIFRGSLGAAGEIGHAPYEVEDYEYYTSGPGIVRSYLSFGGTRDLQPHDVLTYTGDDSTEEMRTHKLARAHFYDTLARLNATLINTLNPEVLVFGGGVSKSIDFKELAVRTKKYALPIPFAGVQLKKFAISDSAGAIGAAMLAFDLLGK